MADLGKVGMVLKGTWSNTATYEVLDVVNYNNGLYVAKQAVPAGTAPTNTTYWQCGFDSSVLGSTDISGIDDGTVTGILYERTRTKSGTTVDLTPYNSTSNMYTIPSDGYIVIASNQQSTGNVQLIVRGSNSVNLAFMYMNITGNYQMQSLFVKKGLKAYVQNIQSGATATFYPLVA